jgi:hypothetical protein
MVTGNSTAPASGNIFLTIETDAETAAKWVVAEVKAGASAAASAINSGLTAVAGLVMPIIEKAEPTVFADITAAVTSFLTSAGSAGSLEDLEQLFLESLEAAESALLAEAKSLEGPILQAIIALVKAAL